MPDEYEDGGQSDVGNNRGSDGEGPNINSNLRSAGTASSTSSTFSLGDTHIWREGGNDR